MECKTESVPRVDYNVTITRGDLLELIRSKTSLKVPGSAVCLWRFRPAATGQGRIWSSVKTPKP